MVTHEVERQFLFVAAGPQDSEGDDALTSADHGERQPGNVTLVEVSLREALFMGLLFVQPSLGDPFQFREQWSDIGGAHHLEAHALLANLAVYLAQLGAGDVEG
ncbi:MAG: hypothetical protein USCGTAYLOR_00712 [Chromatiales bacterium USCg_Taylor]|nr:MAG: hypothetical protein USCGTAYLOR_00712 [Chromatiales bacterium USCg_Taylor]